MRKLTCLATVLVLCLMMIGVTSEAQAGASDNNDDATHATPIRLQEEVTGVVNPDDLFDFYSFEIPGERAIAGKIVMHSPQVGTTFRVESAAGARLFDGSTADREPDREVTLSSEMLPAGVYYIRVSFWSVYAEDHEYTITMDLATTECFADGNEDPANATPISFNQQAKDWICPDDRLDVYRFTIDSDLEAKGFAGLDLMNAGMAKLYIYDSDWNELWFRVVNDIEDGPVGWDFTHAEGGKLAYGDYYLGVFLPLNRDDTLQYILTLDRGALSVTGTMMQTLKPGGEKEKDKHLKATMKLGQQGDQGTAKKKVKVDVTRPAAETVPWPNPYCNINNASRSSLTGPLGSREPTASFIVPGAVGNRSRGLLVGKDDFVYFMSRPGNVLYAYQIPGTEPVWTANTGSDKPPCLDEKGRVYYIHEDRDRLIKAAGNNGVWAWSKAMDQAGVRSVELVGARVYTATVISDPLTTYVCAYSKDGELKWNTGALDGRISGVAEYTPGGYVYIQTSKGLYQMHGTNGAQNWFRRFPPVEGTEGIPGPFPPIISDDGEVWTFHEGSVTSYIFADDGSIVTTLIYPEGKRPYAVALSADKRLYISLGYSLCCYENWNDLLWEKTSTWENTDYWYMDVAINTNGTPYIYYMKIYQPPPETDSFGHVRTHPEQYTHYWVSINRETGDNSFPGSEVPFIRFTSFAPPGLDPLSGYGEMAFGEDYRLILLFYGGEAHFI